jgi:DNA polymerase-3 subunit epsilon
LDIDVNDLHELQRGWADEWSLSMQEFFKKQNRPDFRAELGWPIKD